MSPAARCRASLRPPYRWRRLPRHSGPTTAFLLAHQPQFNAATKEPLGFRAGRDPSVIAQALGGPRVARRRQTEVTRTSLVVGVPTVARTLAQGGEHTEELDLAPRIHAQSTFRVDLPLLHRAAERTTPGPLRPSAERLPLGSFTPGRPGCSSRPRTWAWREKARRWPPSWASETFVWRRGPGSIPLIVRVAPAARLISSSCSSDSSAVRREVPDLPASTPRR